MFLRGGPTLPVGPKPACPRGLSWPGQGPSLIWEDSHMLQSY